MKQRVKARSAPKDLDELQHWIQLESDAIDQDMINRYFDVMPNRVQDIINRQGGLRNY